MQGSTPSPETLARECTTLIRGEVAALLATVRGGGDALWEAPSYCQGWAVKDVVAHVVGAFRIHDGSTRTVLAGGQPEHADPAEIPARMEALAERARALAAQPREQVLAELDQVARRHADHVDGLDGAALSTAVPMPFGSFTVATIAGLVLDECVIHHWDIRQPRDPAAQVTPATVPAMVGFLLPALPLLCLGEKTDGTWQLDVEAPTGGSVTLRVHDGQASAEAGAARSPDVQVAIAGEAFPLLVWGRLDVAAALASGRLRLVAGDRDRALALQRMYPGG